jgi:N-acetylglucosamine malate deacetylase 1
MADGMLVIAPHADDEVLGCASLLGADTLVVYLGIDDFHVVDRTTRLAEVARVSQYFGFPWRVADFPVNRYYTEHRAIVQHLEELIEEVRPSRMFIPSPSYNQDHRTASQACYTALRQHDQHHFVRRVLAYEEPDMYIGRAGEAGHFEPCYFRSLDIERKIHGYRLHASQVRGHRSESILRGMAAHRGAQSMLPAAEAFHVIRWVDPAPIPG